MSDRNDRFDLQIHQQGDTRTLEVDMDLDASPEEVWKALTEAERLKAWFPFQADVSPGVGGKIHMSWDGAWESDLEIRVWEPDKHLRTGWPWTSEDGLAGIENEVLVDYFIEARSGGGTRLRLVHSGFPVGDEWEDIFDGTRRGWSYELRSLKHYLEHHNGRSRRVARVRRPMAGISAAEAWHRLWSPQGLVAEGVAEPFIEGGSYRFTMPGEIELAGRVLVAIPPTDLGLTIEGVENSLFRVAVAHPAGPGEPPEIQLWLATWGALREQVSAIEAAWESALDRILTPLAARSA